MPFSDSASRAVRADAGIGSESIHEEADHGPCLDLAHERRCVRELLPDPLKAIDNALAKNPPLTEVKEYREEGETLHNEGLHAESLEALAKAEKILGIGQ